MTGTATTAPSESHGVLLCITPTGGPAACAIFLGLEGLESVSPIMLRRTLLELVAVRHALEGSRRVPLGRLLEDAGHCGPRQDGRQAAASGSRQRACAPPPAP